MGLHFSNEWIGRDAIVMKPLLQNVDNGSQYNEHELPFWNHVGAILHITDYSPRDTLKFIFNDELVSEYLLPIDFEDGYVQLLEEDMPEEIELGDLMSLF